MEYTKLISCSKLHQKQCLINVPSSSRQHSIYEGRENRQKDVQGAPKKHQRRSILGVFLPSSYPNVRLGLASRARPNLSQRSRLDLGHLYPRPMLRLCYAYPTPTLRPCYDIATTYERRRNDLAMCRFSQRQQKP